MSMNAGSDSGKFGLFCASCVCSDLWVICSFAEEC